MQKLFDCVLIQYGCFRKGIEKLFDCVLVQCRLSSFDSSGIMNGMHFAIKFIFL